MSRTGDDLCRRLKTSCHTADEFSAVFAATPRGDRAVRDAVIDAAMTLLSPSAPAASTEALLRALTTPPFFVSRKTLLSLALERRVPVYVCDYIQRRPTPLMLPKDDVIVHIYAACRKRHDADDTVEWLRDTHGVTMAEYRRDPADPDFLRLVREAEDRRLASAKWLAESQGLTAADYREYAASHPASPTEFMRLACESDDQRLAIFLTDLFDLRVNDDIFWYLCLHAAPPRATAMLARLKTTPRDVARICLRYWKMYEGGSVPRIADKSLLGFLDREYRWKLAWASFELKLPAWTHGMPYDSYDLCETADDFEDVFERMHSRYFWASIVDASNNEKYAASPLLTAGLAAFFRRAPDSDAMMGRLYVEASGRANAKNFSFWRRVLDGAPALSPPVKMEYPLALLFAAKL